MDESNQASVPGIETLAIALTNRHYAARPELSTRYGAAGRAKCLEDARYHLDYLLQSIQIGSPILFTAYMSWSKVMLAARGIPAADLEANLDYMHEVLAEGLADTEIRASALRTIAIARRELARLPDAENTYLGVGEPLADIARDYLTALLDGDRQRAASLVLKEVKAGTSVKEVYLNVFQRTQHEIGRLWQINRITVAEEHYCTAATQLIMAQFYPHIFSTPKIGRRLVAACVNGELHEISVRMIADFFELAGWDTYYLGANVPGASIADMVLRQRAHVVGISATLTTNLGAVAALIKALRSSSSANIKVLVGGAPFNTDPNLWRAVGADASAPDAEQAIVEANRLVSGAGK
jgi:methanogenic corrinoid protein MtbC1